MAETFIIREPSPLLKQAAVYGPEFVAQVLEYERIIHEVAETLATQQGIPLHLLPPRQPPASPHPNAHPHTHPDTHPHALPPP